MTPFLAVFLFLLVASGSYAAGRLHGQLSYRIGYRFGYRQGYFDGDRGAWSRRRREAAVITSTGARPTVPVDRAPVAVAPKAVLPYRAHAVARCGTTYTGATFAGTGSAGGHRPDDALAG